MEVIPVDAAAISSREPQAGQASPAGVVVGRRGGLRQRRGHPQWTRLYQRPRVLSLTAGGRKTGRQTRM